MPADGTLSLRPVGRPWSRLGASPGLHGGHLLVAAVWALALFLAVRLALVLLADSPAVPPLVPYPPTDTSVLARVDPFHQASAPAAEALPVTGLPLRLHGVRADRRTGQGTAIIATEGGDQAVFAVGDEVSPGARLESVAEDHVVLNRGGIREALWLDQGETTPVSRFAGDGLEPQRAPLLDPEPATAPLPIDQPDSATPDREMLDALSRAVPPEARARPSFERGGASMPESPER